jgi:hypothetical protein
MFVVLLVERLVVDPEVGRQVDEQTVAVKQGRSPALELSVR